MAGRAFVLSYKVIMCSNGGEVLDWLISQGDALEILQTLPVQSVQCCVTSPPYWGLRDYGVAGQMGLEPTPGEYVAKMVEVFREVRRVLRDDGTLWLNLGDTYAGYWGDKTAKDLGRRSSADTNGWTNGFNMNARPNFHTAFDSLRVKPKDLVGIPWMVAFALRADGWYLRSDIIWAKPNPMPESVTDRPTKAHEYIFLMSKAERYYYDHEAIKEEGITHLHYKRYGPGAPSLEREAENWNQQGPYKPHKGFKSLDTTKGRNKRTVWTVATRLFPKAHFATFPPALIEPCILAGSRPSDLVLDPFSGAGTTGLVALRHGRRYLGIELNPKYVAMSEKRIQDDMPLFNSL